MFCVLLLPGFPLQAVLRLEPPLATGTPCALIDDSVRPPVVLEANSAARRLGITPGLTATQAQSRCQSVLLLPRSEHAEQAATALLLDAALRLSPLVEHTAPGQATADITGALPDTPWEQRGTELVLLLGDLGLHLRAGVAPTPLAALYAARRASPVRLLGPGESRRFLDTLPLSEAGPSEELSRILLGWGVRTLGDLMDLPVAEVARRLGAPGVALRERAAGGAPRPLRCITPPENHRLEHEFPAPIETLAPLLLVLRRLIGQLCLRLQTAELVAAQVSLELRLDGSRPEEPPGTRQHGGTTANDEIRMKNDESRGHLLSAQNRIEGPDEDRGPETRTGSSKTHPRPLGAPASRRYPDSQSASNFVLRTSSFASAPRTPQHHQLTLTLPHPSHDPEVVLRLLQTRLETTRTETPVVALTLELFPVPLSRRQQEFFDGSLRDPQRFAETLAALSAIAGDGRVGTPVLLDTHRPDAFRLDPPPAVLPPEAYPVSNYNVAEPASPFGPTSPENQPPRSTEPRSSHPPAPTSGLPAPPTFHHTALSATEPSALQPSAFPPSALPLRRFRPAPRIEVTCDAADRPIAVSHDLARGTVVAARGPWRSSGEWWERGRAWAREEWDVELSPGGLYRLTRDGPAWLLEGVYG